MDLDRSKSLTTILVAFVMSNLGCSEHKEILCVSSPAPIASIDTRGPTLDEICPAVADKLCPYWARCGCDISDIDACRADVVTQCTGFVAHADVRDALVRGTLGWSGSEARAFLNALDGATAGCEPVNLDLSSLAVGRVPDFRPCIDISGAFTECRDGSSCAFWRFFATEPPLPGFYCIPGDGVTQSSQRAGERCSKHPERYSDVCAEGLRCAPICGSGNFEGVCATGLEIGSDCSDETDCASGFCEPPRSSPGSSVGRCGFSGTVANGEPCVWPRSCASGYCTRDVAEHGKCAPRANLGEPCTNGWECDRGTCSDHGTVPVQQCEDDATRCTGAADCPGSSCVTVLGGTCVPFSLSAIGEPCETSSSCDSRRCDLGTRVCAAGLEPGAECRPDYFNECALGTCIDFQCRVGDQPRDALCDTPGVCTSRSCVAGRCAAPVCTARIDPTGYGEFWESPAILTP